MSPAIVGPGYAHEYCSSPARLVARVLVPAGAGARNGKPSQLSRSVAQGLGDEHASERPLRPQARRSRGLRHDQLRGGHRGHVCRLARRPLCRADERQAACQGVRLHPGEFRREALLRHARPRRHHRRGGPRSARAQGDRRRHHALLRLHGGRRSHRHGRGRGHGSGVAVLHLRHHRPAQGRHAHPSQSAGDDAELLRRRRSAAGRRLDGACRADQPWLGPVELRHGGARRRSRSFPRAASTRCPRRSS